MFQLSRSPNTGFFRTFKLKRLAKQVRNGIVPKGVSQDEVFEALRITRPKSALEMFGLVNARVFDKTGTLKADHGLVGVKKVTLEFAELLADAMTSSGASALIDDFTSHEMGSGSTAEASTDQALVTAQDGRNIGTQTHGATSNLYATTATITATSTYEVREHGVFNQTSTTADYLLDRSVVTGFNVNTDDEVEWTYTLTINTET
jgi:hypothetical protein